MERDIDLVIPMVFPADPEWRREYQRFHIGDATKSERFRSWGTEELLVRCCIKFMPWLRRIYILLAQESQVQEWMKNLAAEPQGAIQPEVRTVFHREFMPANMLPCFASPCIEMFLHKIPGLSEYFIYGNDDMFPLSPLQPEDFFRQAEPDGTLLPCQKITERVYPPNPNIFQRKCMYQLNMIAERYGKHYTAKWPDTGHIFAAIRKSSCEEVWRRHGDEITYYLSPLKRNDRSYNHYIYMLYQHFEGLYVEHRPPRHYTDHETPTQRLAEIIRDPQAGMVCLNDNEKIFDWKVRAEMVHREIERKLEGAAVTQQHTGQITE